MLKHLILPCLCLLPSLAAAETVQESILSQLRDQGFTRIEVSRTLLGRTRLEATSDRLEREMVFNPQTGEILRDYWQERNDDGRAAPQIMDPQGGREDRSGRGSDDSGGRGGSGSGKGGDDGGGSGNSGRGGGDDGDRGGGSDDGGGNSGRGGGDDGGGDRGGSDDGGKGDGGGHGGRGGGDDGDDD
ncbi:hypothetical protein SAMN05444339_10994 [Loktanella atrilutea]|uniref:Peptidase propeptide and YPEB domain-containing protein n=1 Tax=Loktanella atrilutea TaxID=366533 RepID=A0A1M5D9S2_LOKAT|nr:hypothetical protein [Loktanella atrilutea]SHF63819.1 hypothetical protein SAMN05444339_10994 [Loktanella atrilutea]